MTEDTDIHGTDRSQFQRVFKVERDATDPKVARFFFSTPLEDGQVVSLLEHLRTWHP